MTIKRAVYWIATATVALAAIAGGTADLLLLEPVKEAMDHLGYPHYFARILGFWKVLGGVAILAPGFRRVKEWAYAGIFFDLSGAVASHLAVGDGVANFAPPLLLALALVLSYQLLWAR